MHHPAPIRQDLAEDCSARGILSLLKEKGPSDATTLATHLRISVPGVRQHLYELQTSELVTFAEEARPKGRPVKLWRLTPKAHGCFPDNHAAFTVSLLRSVQEVFGPKGMCELLTRHADKQARLYRERIKSLKTVADRIKALVALRSEEGYMAEVCREANGDLLLIENHCPISCVARSCGDLCSNELNVFREVLGPSVQVERVEHMVSGQRRCVYRITEKRRRR